jgi:hypothetical protein
MQPQTWRLFSKFVVNSSWRDPSSSKRHRCGQFCVRPHNSQLQIPNDRPPWILIRGTTVCINRNEKYPLITQINEKQRPQPETSKPRFEISAQSWNSEQHRSPCERFDRKCFANGSYVRLEGNVCGNVHLNSRFRSKEQTT